MNKVLGIIAEYNPFHNGHLYHIEQAKKITKADYCVCIISGNFTQRGEPSIVDKWSKAYMAVCGGADLVIELPTIYSVSSAENFAKGAIRILNNMKIISDVAFGTECENLEILDNIANVLYYEPEDYKIILKHELGKGLSYPEARENAIMMYLNDVKKYANVLSSPNNILAVEYLKSLKSEKSNIRPIAIQRKNVSYNEKKVVNNFASATAIREFMRDTEYSEVRKTVPKSTYQILSENFKKGNVILGLKEYEKEIIFTLRKMTIKEIADLPDVSEGLEYSIKRAVENSNNIHEVIEYIKSKRYTQTRIQRILIYALLGITKKQMENSKKITPYVRVLAFNSKGRNLISIIMKENTKLNMITSVNKYLENNKKPNKDLNNMLNTDMFATNVYTMAYKKESKSNLDFTHNMIIIK